MIEMYEPGEAKNPEIISSGTMWPCITIAIYDKKNKHCYMLHQPNADHGDDFENFIINTLKRCNVKDVKVIVCGGAIAEEEGMESFNEDEEEIVSEESEEMMSSDNVLDSRAHVEKLIEKYFNPKQCEVKWTKDGKTSELILDTSNGKYEIKYGKI